MTESPAHATHPPLIAQLGRPDGHMRTVIDMIAAGSHRVGIAQQMQAVEPDVAKAKRALIPKHIDHCLDANDAPQDRDDLRAISRYRGGNRC